MQGNFGLLPEPGGRFGSFSVSLVVNISVGALLILFAAARVHQVKVQKENTAVLIFPVEQPKPYVPPVPKVKVVAPPPKVEPQAQDPTTQAGRRTAQAGRSEDSHSSGSENRSRATQGGCTSSAA